jgi:hypothetical protein
MMTNHGVIEGNVKLANHIAGYFGSLLPTNQELLNKVKIKVTSGMKEVFLAPFSVEEVKNVVQYTRHGNT